MESRELDSMIQETLDACASGISMSSDLQKQIKQEIRSKSEEKSMIRRISKRKVIVAAAVLCLLGSMAAVAAGKVTGWVSSSNPNRPDFVSLKEIGKAEAAMGCSIQAVEQFSNGFQFTAGHIIEVRELDDQGVVLGTFPKTNLNYSRGGDRAVLSLYPAGKAAETEKHGEIVKISYGGTVLTYTKDIYKFVPVGYEVTQEEKALMESGELYISFGSDAVEVQEICAVSWDMGQARYQLMAFDAEGLTQEALVQMAEEVIDSEK